MIKMLTASKCSYCDKIFRSDHLAYMHETACHKRTNNIEPSKQRSVSELLKKTYEMLASGSESVAFKANDIREIADEIGRLNSLVEKYKTEAENQKKIANQILGQQLSKLPDYI